MARDAHSRGSAPARHPRLPHRGSPAAAAARLPHPGGVKADARYGAVAADDLSRVWTFRLFPDGTGEGLGPDGVVHPRFRGWKEALRDD